VSDESHAQTKDENARLSYESMLKDAEVKLQQLLARHDVIEAAK
jgi:hypothetical protein